MTTNGNGKSWTEYFRIITPFLLLVLSGFSTLIFNRLGDIDHKLFEHLTNAELHFPRTQIVTKAEYDATLKGIERQLEALNRKVCKEDIQ